MKKFIAAFICIAALASATPSLAQSSVCKKRNGQFNYTVSKQNPIRPKFIVTCNSGEFATLAKWEWSQVDHDSTCADNEPSNFINWSETFFGHPNIPDPNEMFFWGDGLPTDDDECGSRGGWGRGTVDFSIRITLTCCPVK